MQDLEVEWQPQEAKSELDGRLLADYGPIVEGNSAPSSPADTVAESELYQNCNVTTSEAPLNEEDLDIEEADRASSQRKDEEGESLVVQVISPHSDSDEPKSPEPLGLVEELEEEEELEWDRGNVAEVVSYCRECRDMLVNGSVTCNSDDELAASGGVSTPLIGEGQKLVVVDSCVLLSSLPLVKEILQDGSCKLYICYQVTVQLSLFLSMLASLCKCVGASGIEFPKAGRISGQVEIKLEMAGKCRSPWDCLSNKVRTRKSRR